jgi:hypothetical protein
VLLENISLGRTDALSAHRLFRTVLSLSQPFDARYAVEYPLFALFSALCRARIITIPTIRLGSLHTKLPKCKVRIVFIRARHSAKIWAKSLIVSEEKYCNHRAPMQWNGSFWPKILPSGKLHRSDTQETKHAVQFYLRNRTTAQTEYLMDVLLYFCWNFEYVNSLAIRDTHQFKKRKIWNIAHFCSENNRR